MADKNPDGQVDRVGDEKGAVDEGGQGSRSGDKPDAQGAEVPGAQEAREPEAPAAETQDAHGQNDDGLTVPDGDNPDEDNHDEDNPDEDNPDGDNPDGDNQGGGNGGGGNDGNGESEKDFRWSTIQLACVWAGVSVLILVVPPLLASQAPDFWNQITEWWREWAETLLWTVGMFTLLFYACIFVFRFTADLGDEDSVVNGGSTRMVFTSESRKNVRHIIRHGYVIMFSAFFLSVAPFVLFSESDEEQVTVGESSPIGILQACQDTDDPLVTACIKKEKSEEPLRRFSQWVVNIGGSVFPPPALLKAIDAQQKAVAANENVERAAQNAEEARQAAAKAKVAAETASKNAATARQKAAAGSDSVQQALEKAEKESEMAQKESQAADEVFQKAKEGSLAANTEAEDSTKYAQNAASEWLTVKSDVTKDLRTKIVGGLVVPLYLLVLALMGAAVGLARRLPEYQRRGSSFYSHHYWINDKSGQEVAKDPDKPLPMSPAEVRESVVFQIMQYLSAPLVAIAGYAVIQPNEWQSVVILGFASGFSTEAVLSLIRKGVDQLAGGAKKPP